MNEMPKLKKLLNMNWEDNWRDCVLYETPFVLHYGFDRWDCMDISSYPIYKIMEQLENSGMSVYEAYLKGLEAKYITKDIKSVQRELLKLKKDEIKFIKKGNIDPNTVKITHDISNILYQQLAKLRI